MLLLVRMEVLSRCRRRRFCILLLKKNCHDDGSLVFVFLIFKV